MIANSNPFQLLNLPEQLSLDEEELERKTREAVKKFHPDNGGDESDFAIVREAGNILKSPARRLAAAVEIAGKKFDDRGSVPEKIMDHFGSVATTLENVDGFIRQREKAGTGLGKAVLDAQVPQLKSEVEELIGRLGNLETDLVSRFSEFDVAGWEASADAMGEASRALRFLNRWLDQLREATGKLFAVLLGG